jgi:hypothetical protein
VNAGQPTPFLGLDERLAFGAFFLWLFVLVALLWRGGQTETVRETP